MPPNGSQEDRRRKESRANCTCPARGVCIDSCNRSSRGTRRGNNGRRSLSFQVFEIDRTLTETDSDMKRLAILGWILGVVALSAWIGTAASLLHVTVLH